MGVTEIGPAGIPSLGLGTYKLTGRQVTDIVSAALSEGYRHIDTAQAYGNEEGVGQGIAASSVPRSEVFLTTKIMPGSFAEDDFVAAAEASLNRLGTDYVDLLLLHWPSFDVPVEATMAGMNRLIADGKVRHGGISNFTVARTKDARAALDTPLAANQVEVHPFIDQSGLLPWLHEEGIPFEAYSPIARGEVMGDDTLKEIAEAHGVTEAQVSLSWILSKPLGVAIPKTGSEERLAPNLAAAEIDLTGDQIARIDALARPDGRMISPEGMAPDWD